jgi:hypothetical protein
MNPELGSGREVAQDAQVVARPQQVMFAKSPPGTTLGVVCESEPSSLALLAAGVAGMAARRYRRSERLKSLESPQTATQA